MLGLGSWLEPGALAGLFFAHRALRDPLTCFFEVGNHPGFGTAKERFERRYGGADQCRKWHGSCSGLPKRHNNDEPLPRRQT
jgi:hypothetical protein